jgi:hypothetical protein
MAATLVKSPLESRAYTFDFTGASPQGGRRGTVFSEPLLQQGEVFGVPTLLPLLLMSLVGSVPTPTVTVTRGDGLTSDITIGTATVNQVSGTVVVMVSGGTSGQTYLVSVVMTSSNGNLIVLQGNIQVMSVLP